MNASLSLEDEWVGETIETHPVPEVDRPETVLAEIATRTGPNELDDEWESWS